MESTWKTTQSWLWLCDAFPRQRGNVFSPVDKQFRRRKGQGIAGEGDAPSQCLTNPIWITTECHMMRNFVAAEIVRPATGDAESSGSGNVPVDVLPPVGILQAWPIRVTEHDRHVAVRGIGQKPGWIGRVGSGKALGVGPVMGVV